MASTEETTKSTTTATESENNGSAAAFVTNFTNHHRRCLTLAKRFTDTNPRLKDSAAISQLCRASQEMLDQAKEARTLTEIYLALDDKHRDVVHAMITSRFKDIVKLARASWLRFCDSVELARDTNPEIAAAQQEFQPHADQFQQALRAFIAMTAGVH